MVKFNNGDLTHDIEKIVSFDPPITVSKGFDGELDFLYILDVGDNSYFYQYADERNEDFNKLKSIVPKFSFIEL